MSGALLLVEPIAGGCLRSSVDVDLLERLLVWWLRGLRRRAHAFHLIMMRLKLRLLFCGQQAKDLRHHLRVRDFQFNLNLRARFSRCAYSRFIECACHRVWLPLMQCAQLIE